MDKVTYIKNLLDISIYHAEELKENLLNDDIELSIIEEGIHCLKFLRENPDKPISLTSVCCVIDSLQFIKEVVRVSDNYLDFQKFYIFNSLNILKLEIRFIKNYLFANKHN